VAAVRAAAGLPLRAIPVVVVDATPEVAAPEAFADEDAVGVWGFAGSAVFSFCAMDFTDS
jgi:hypothetical protein